MLLSVGHVDDLDVESKGGLEGMMEGGKGKSEQKPKRAGLIFDAEFQTAFCNLIPRIISCIVFIDFHSSARVSTRDHSPA